MEPVTDWAAVVAALKTSRSARAQVNAIGLRVFTRISILASPVRFSTVQYITDHPPVVPFTSLPPPPSPPEVLHARADARQTPLRARRDNCIGVGPLLRRRRA